MHGSNVLKKQTNKFTCSIHTICMYYKKHQKWKMEDSYKCTSGVLEVC